MIYTYAVAIILYNPDISALAHINNYNLFSKILLIDNTDCSLDISTASKLYELKQLDMIIYHSMGQNLGMSEALNYAYEWAFYNNIDYLLTMDQDTDFPSSEIKKIIDVIESRRFLDVAFFTSNWRKMYISKSKISYGRWKYRRDENVKINMAMTSGTFYNVKTIKQYLPLTNLFIGMVDDDISYALEQNNQIGIMVGSANLSQRVGELVEDTFFNRLLHKISLSPERYYYMGRNSMFLLRKYTNTSKIVKRIKKKRFRILGNIVLCEKQKIKKLKMWIRGSDEIKQGNLRLGKYDC